MKTFDINTVLLPRTSNTNKAYRNEEKNVVFMFSAAFGYTEIRNFIFSAELYVHVHRRRSYLGSFVCH
jgi:hypothetical protein